MKFLPYIFIIARIKAKRTETTNALLINKEKMLRKEMESAITTTMKNQSLSINSTLNLVRRRNSKIAKINATTIPIKSPEYWDSFSTLGVSNPRGRLGGEETSVIWLSTTFTGA